MTVEVDIVLATYNGQKYLSDFLDSLESQTFSNFRLIVRDDFSKDDTAKILDMYVSRSILNIKIIADDKGNLGAKGNFEELLKYVEAPYIMFADQDDVWFPEKIAKSFDAIDNISFSRSNSIAVVFTDLTVVDEYKNIINSSYWKNEKINPQHSMKFENILLQNVAAGCSMILTRSLINFALPFPPGVIMHDWWIMLVASAFGDISYLNEATLLYRQHSNNSVGSKGFNFLYGFKKILNFRRQIKPRLYETQVQAQEFYDKFYKCQEISPRLNKLLIEYATISSLSYFERLRWIYSNQMKKIPFSRQLGLYLFV